MRLRNRTAPEAMAARKSLRGHRLPALIAVAAGLLLGFSLPIGLHAQTPQARTGEIPPTHLAPPAEQAELWDWIGRPLPEPEVLRPTLDPALPPYLPRHDVELKGYLVGTQTNVLPVLVERWIEAFRKYYPGVSIDIETPYLGGAGADALIAGKVDFSFQSRELKPENTVDFKKKYGYDPLLIPVSFGSYRAFGFDDALVFIVNKNNPLEKITYAQVDAIFSKSHLHGGQGAITTWGQLGLTGDWADKPIHLWMPKPWNGYEEFIRQRILNRDGERGQWRDDATTTELIFPVAPGVGQDRYAMGFSGTAFLNDQVKLLSIAVDEKTPAVAPTYENMALATYPLVRNLYIVVNKPPGKAIQNSLLKEFIRFILSREGQQVVVDEGIFIPLRAEQTQKGRALLDR